MPDISALDTFDIPEHIPPGQRIVSLRLSDGNMAVKLDKWNVRGEQLYGVHTRAGKFLKELLTIDQAAARSALGSAFALGEAGTYDIDASSDDHIYIYT
jgi:hypothetical protein